MATSTIVYRKMIKPSSPTPPSLRRHNLSFLDYIYNPLYIPIVSFYSIPQNCNNIITQISHLLESSLSKVLFSYYPFAGRINDNNSYVDCNDAGAEYLQVRINCPISEILNHPYNDVVDVLFPQHLPWSISSLNRSPLVVQLSHFDCGGIAISVCLSHKMADGYSLSRFLNDWACTARGHPLDFEPSAQFNASSFIPLMDDPPAIPLNIVAPEPQPGHVSRIYNFSSSSLEKLKADIVANATNSSGVVVQNPTRVEVATALLHKCGVAVSMEKSGGKFKPTVLSHRMNIRPPIPLNTMGNAMSVFGTITKTEDEINLPNFVAQLRKAKQQLKDELRNMNTHELTAHVLERNTPDPSQIIDLDMFDAYTCTSFCNFGLYTIDFGWGRPLRVTLVRHSMKNHFLFMDHPTGDGINVLVTLTEADMLIFQSNKELLDFASPLSSLN